MCEYRIEGCTFFDNPGSIAIHIEQEDQLYAFVVSDTIINAELAPWSVWRVMKRRTILAAVRQYFAARLRQPFT